MILRRFRGVPTSRKRSGVSVTSRELHYVRTIKLVRTGRTRSSSPVAEEYTCVYVPYSLSYLGLEPWTTPSCGTYDRVRSPACTRSRRARAAEVSTFSKDVYIPLDLDRTRRRTRGKKK